MSYLGLYWADLDDLWCSRVSSGCLGRLGGSWSAESQLLAFFRLTDPPEWPFLAVFGPFLPIFAHFWIYSGFGPISAVSVPPGVIPSQFGSLWTLLGGPGVA